MQSQKKKHTYLKHILHFEAVVAQFLDAEYLGQWNITDYALALCLCIAQRLRGQTKEARLRGAQSEAFTALRSFRHHSGTEELNKYVLLR